MNKDSKILVAGHSGLGGSAMVRRLRSAGFENLVLFSKENGDLTDVMVAERLFHGQQPDYVFLFAARVGGILANSNYPVEFMLENMRIEMNVMESAKKYEVKKLLFLGSACAYPKFAEVPIQESSLLSGEMEPTNIPYALAKISGVVLCDAYRKQYGCDFISCMPTNLYGVGDTYDLQNSHVVPAMIMKMHQAKKEGLSNVTLWGTGNPTRELLFADDLAEACFVLMEHYSQLGTINIGSWTDVSMRLLGSVVARVVGYTGGVVWDTSKPDGTPNRRIDSSRIFQLGWSPKTSLGTGIAASYRDFLNRYETSS